MRGQIDKVPVMYQNAALDESFMKNDPGVIFVIPGQSIQDCVALKGPC